MRLNWDIGTRVLTAALVPTLVLGILLTITTTYLRLADLDDALSQRGQALARQLASSAEFGLFSGNRPVLQQLASSALTAPDLKGVAIFDRDGSLLVAAGQQIRAGGPVSGETRIQKIDDSMLRIVEPVRHARSLEEDPYTLTREGITVEAQLGEVVLLLSREQLENRKAEQILAAAITLAFVLGGSVLLSVMLSRSVSRPLQKIAQAMTDIGLGDLSVRVPIVGGGTLRRLAEGVNDMAGRLTLSREDLTQRIEAATLQLRERTEEAERANLAKTRFLAAASHDLRQPMHALGLFVAELAQKQHEGNIQGLIDRIAASAEAMENLLDSLLDISKLDAGVVVATAREFPLASLFQRIANDFGHLAVDKGLRLRVRPSPLWGYSDPVLLERILGNLVGNALRYTPSGSILVAARKRGDHVLVEVRDSGIGIPAEEQVSIFQEFVQLGNTARDRSKGLGLGLAIVRRLADLLHHPITLRSAPGRGSAFGILLPLSQPTSTAVTDAVPDSEFTGAVVTVIDDDALAQESLTGLLRAWGCFVVASDSLDSLLERLDELEVTPTVIVSDFRLPGELSGLDVIAVLRSRFGKRLPALLLSGDTGSEILRRATDQGVPLLNKPVRPARLRAALVHLFATHKA